MRRKDLLDIQSLSADEITYLLDTAQSFREVVERPVKKVPTLRGKSVACVFFEASTRTRTSFEHAAKIMSADTYSLAASTSSAVKGVPSEKVTPSRKSNSQLVSSGLRQAVARSGTTARRGSIATRLP